ncbi:MAG: tRNA (adenosine(37)-N6)-dimethylallyltransferase MiaA [Spirochaetota bacterium]
MLRRPPVIFLFGPTAVGKTAIIASLPRGLAEVISADSMQVYRGMDIGTAKPDAILRASVPHHLIDIRDPDQRYDVGAFVDDANELMREIHARAMLPVVSGGTGFYFKHLLLGLPQAPPSDPEVRERVLLRAEREGTDALYEELGRVDPQSAARIDGNDRYRITRAIEVFEQTGRPLSSFAMEGPPREDVDVRSFRLTRPREALAERVRVRVRSMFDEGLRHEVETLVGAGYGSDAPGMRAIGYREFFDAHGALRPAREDDAIAEAIAGNTRRYAKRQETFFRRLPGVTTVDLGKEGGAEPVIESIVARARELDTP